MEKFNLNDDELKNTRISRARIRGRGNTYFKTLVFPIRKEMILLDDAVKILEGKLTRIQVYNYDCGGVYFEGTTRCIRRERYYIMVGCQPIFRENIKKLKNYLKLK